MTDLSHLPKSMLKRPEIRGLTLRVFPGDGPKHFRVPGTERIHDVWVFGDSIKCDCTAATTGRLCAHYYAVKRHVQKETTHG